VVQQQVGHQPVFAGEDQVCHVTLGRQPLLAKAVAGLVGSCFLMCRRLVYSSQVPPPLSTKGREARWFRIDRKYSVPKQIADTWFSSYFGPILSTGNFCRTITWGDSSPTRIVRTNDRNHTVRSQVPGWLPCASRSVGAIGVFPWLCTVAASKPLEGVRDLPLP
jgi:hypothetical protein